MIYTSIPKINIYRLFFMFLCAFDTIFVWFSDVDRFSLHESFSLSNEAILLKASSNVIFCASTGLLLMESSLVD